MELSAGGLPSRDPGVVFLRTVGCPQSCVRFVSELEYLSNKMNNLLNNAESILVIPYWI